MKAIKKPVEVECIQWAGNNFDEIKKFCSDISKESDGKLSIPTLEGVMFASLNDWIIKGVKGEFYPCKPDIFNDTYEIVKPKPKSILDVIREHIVKSFEGSKIEGDQVWIPKAVIDNNEINTDYWKINLYGPDCEGCINITYEGYRGWDPIAADREDVLTKVVDAIKDFITSTSAVNQSDLLMNFSVRLNNLMK